MRQKLELELELQRFREALRAEKDRYAAIDALGLESELREQNPILKQAKSGGAWCVVRCFIDLLSSCTSDSQATSLARGDWLESNIRSMASLAGNIVRSSIEPDLHQFSKSPSPPPRSFEASLLPSPKPEAPRLPGLMSGTDSASLERLSRRGHGRSFCLSLCFVIS